MPTPTGATTFLLWFFQMDMAVKDPDGQLCCDQSLNTMVEDAGSHEVCVA